MTWTVKSCSVKEITSEVTAWSKEMEMAINLSIELWARRNWVKPAHLSNNTRFEVDRSKIAVGGCEATLIDGKKRYHGYIISWHIWNFVMENAERIMRRSQCL